MEALFALLQTPEGLVLIELLTVVGLMLGFGTVFAVIVWLFKDTREGRRGIYEKIDNKTSELHARIDETKQEVQSVHKELHEHALEDTKRQVEDARRWGKIAGKLGVEE